MAEATHQACRVPGYRQVSRLKSSTDTSPDPSKLNLISQVTPCMTPIRLSESRFVWRLLKCLCLCIHPPQRRVYVSPQPSMSPLIPPQSLRTSGMKTLVLDLDETLVHSTFKQIENPDVKLDLLVEDREVGIYVRCRPGLQQLLESTYKLYELVVFTASMDKYANPLLDILDPAGLIEARLFRDHCNKVGTGYSKDLRTLGRDLSQVILVDVRSTQNSPDSYTLQPENAIPIRTYIDDEYDTELFKLIPLLENLATVSDVREGIKALNLSAHSLLPEPVLQREDIPAMDITDGTQDDLRLDLNSPRKM